MPKSPQDARNSKARSGGRLTRLQEAQLSAVRRVSEAVTRVVPPLPRPPFADRLPTAERVVNGHFDRARRLLENQRAFALALVEAVGPVTRKIGARGRAKRRRSRGRRVKRQKVESGAEAEERAETS